MGQGRLYWYHWAPTILEGFTPAMRWGLASQAELCATRLYHPETCTRLPAACTALSCREIALGVDSSKVSRSPSDPQFAIADLREDRDYTGQLRITTCTVSAGWLQGEGQGRMTWSSMLSIYKDGAGGSLLRIYFKQKPCMGGEDLKGELWNKTLGTSQLLFTTFPAHMTEYINWSCYTDTHKA